MRRHLRRPAAARANPARCRPGSTGPGPRPGSKPAAAGCADWPGRRRPNSRPAAPDHRHAGRAAAAEHGHAHQAEALRPLGLGEQPEEIIRGRSRQRRSNSRPFTLGDLSAVWTSSAGSLGRPSMRRRCQIWCVRLDQEPIQRDIHRVVEATDHLARGQPPRDQVGQLGGGAVRPAPPAGRPPSRRSPRWPRTPRSGRRSP